MTRTALRLARAACTALLSFLAAAPGVAAAQSLSPAARTQALAEVRRVVSANFHTPERAPAIAAGLQAREAAGRLSSSSPQDFATAVSEALRAAENDGHLWMIYDPQQSASLARASAGGGYASGDAYWDQVARRTNHGLSEMKVLPGNVRYLKISGFYWRSDATGRLYDGAMTFLKDGDAAIVDLRGNGGGWGSAVRYAVSHFFPADDERLLITFRDEARRPSQSRVLSYLPAGRVSAPLFVLIDGGSASAAEEFAYHVKQFKLGTLVGAKTAGGANNNRLFPVAGGFVLSVPTYQPVHALSGGNWERTGVAPDLEAAPERALAAAHLRALEGLGAKAASEEDRRRYAWAAEVARAELNPVGVAAADLARYAGVYGDRSVRVEDGGLVYQREGRPEARLRPLGGGLFAMAGADDVRLRFHGEAGPVRELEAVYLQGGGARFPRTR